MLRIILAVLCTVTVLFIFPGNVISAQTPTPLPEITPADLVGAVNQLRVANGLPALIVSDIIMGVAQTTAETMAGSGMSGHIGGIRDRIKAAGYGVNDTVWATENFAMGPSSLDAIIYMAWADDLHMKPMADPNYCHVGAGVATANDGTVYYIVQAAYTSNTPCSSHKKTSVVQSAFTATPIISQYMSPVLTVTPLPDGSIRHIVQWGQTVWSIATAYRVKVEDLINYNYYLTEEDTDVYVGQHIYIPVNKMTPIAPISTDIVSIIPTSHIIIPSPIVFKITATNTAGAITVRGLTLTPTTLDERLHKNQDTGNRSVRTIILLTVIAGAAMVFVGFIFRQRQL